MKLPGNVFSGAATVAGALALASLIALPAAARDRKEPLPDVSGPSSDYPVLVGAPFLVDGITYTPADTLNYDAVGRAVLLETLEASARISGAHRTLPVPSYVEVTSLDSGRTVLVRLDQRGPMRGDALVALSPMAWAQLGLPASAVGSANPPVRVRRVNPPEQERALLRTGQTAPLRMDTPPGLLAALRRKLGVEPPVTDLPVTVKPAAIATLPPKPIAALAPPPKSPPSRRPIPVLKPAAAAVIPPDEMASARPPARPSTSGQRYYVQVGAFAQRGNADAAARKSGGSLVRAGRVWRVRSGPFSTGTEADSALAKARRAGYASARTVRE